MDNNKIPEDKQRSYDEIFSDNQSNGSYTFERERAGYNRSNAMRRAKARRSRTKKMAIMIALVVVLAVLWIVAAFAIVRGVLGTETPSDDTADTTENSVVADGTENTGGEDDPQSPSASFGTVTMSANDYKYGKLILINSKYKYDQSGDTMLKSELVELYSYNNGTYLVAQSSEHIKLRNDTVKALNSMFSAFKDETKLAGYCLRDYYCFCTNADQQKWFEAEEKKHGAGAVSYEFKGGESEHEAGRAFDLKVDFDGEGVGGAVYISQAVETEPKYSWIYDNCYKYGIIFRYPNDKASVTGVDMKDNQTLHTDHFRYVGVPAAMAMHENNWTLEEFLVNIQKYSFNGDHLKVQGIDGTKYEMYYFAANSGASTEVKIPTDLPYEISGDNMGGYIVTVTVK